MNDFDQAQALLAGERFLPAHRSSAAKVRAIVTMPPGSDLRIVPETIEVRPGRRGKIGHHSIDMAPGLIWDLLHGMGLDAATIPVVGVYRRLPHYARSFPTNTGEIVVWIVPGVEAIEIRIRPLIGERPPSGPMPEQGPWRYPEPLQERPPDPIPEPQYIDFESDRTCPHCRNAARSYRRLQEGWFVCRACGRSFASDRLGE